MCDLHVSVQTSHLILKLQKSQTATKTQNANKITKNTVFEPCFHGGKKNRRPQWFQDIPEVDFSFSVKRQYLGRKITDISQKEA